MDIKLFALLHLPQRYLWLKINSNKLFGPARRATAWKEDSGLHFKDDWEDDSHSVSFPTLHLLSIPHHMLASDYDLHNWKWRGVAWVSPLSPLNLSCDRPSLTRLSAETDLHKKIGLYKDSIWNPPPKAGVCKCRHITTTLAQLIISLDMQCVI